MPSQPLTSVENNFTRGLITEFTGLNFPENAAIATSNCEYTIVGDVVRRLGINTESGGTFLNTTTLNLAQSEYVWNNPGGDGNSKLVVRQVGGTLYFYNIATSTIIAPLSKQLLVGTISVAGNVAFQNTFDPTSECQYADGNGYLFVYHKSCEPFYVTYNAVSQVVASNPIIIQIRDFQGVVDNLNVNTRPSTLSADHQYNLQNQGWTQGGAWTAFASNHVVQVGSQAFTVASGITGITNGQVVDVEGRSGGHPLYASATGTVTSYSGTTLTINITAVTGTNAPTTFVWDSITISPTNTGYINTWFTAEGNYPSNADVWWYFKNSSNVFDPATQQANVTLSTGNAPQGHYILNAFNQDRASVSTLPTITPVVTSARPTTGAWFQGRVWFTGVNGFQAATGDASFYTWTENIYFSTVVTGISDFGLCYQTNDPTSEILNGELVTDGGVFPVVGSGTIHKLWPIMNGLLVFANNGVWFITGSQGIGFAANDFTITKISSVKVLSSKSFVDVLGLPYFWNEEGIYQVIPDKNGSLTVEPITVGTILSYYNTIPLASKKYARGQYDPVDYVIKWVFRSTQEGDITSRYNYDTILNYNTYNKAFFPYNVSSNGVGAINGILYISYPYVSTVTPIPGFKYLMSNGNSSISFAEENDSTYVDWGTANFVSTFTTGYKVHGQGLKKFQVPYINVFSRNVANYMAYYLEGIWDYAISSNSGRMSTNQFIEVYDINHGVTFKRIRIRGRGYTLQLKFSSADGKPFDFIGWSVFETQNTSV